MIPKKPENGIFFVYHVNLVLLTVVKKCFKTAFFTEQPANKNILYQKREDVIVTYSQYVDISKRISDYLKARLFAIKSTSGCRQGVAAV